MTAKDRARDILNALPLSEVQRKLYFNGLDRMTEEEIKLSIDKLEKSLKEAPVTLVAARKLLEEMRNRS